MSFIEFCCFYRYKTQKVFKNNQLNIFSPILASEMLALVWPWFCLALVLCVSLVNKGKE